MKLSVIGLGKLGLCAAACFAAKGHSVMGHDINDAVISSLKDKKVPIAEPGLTDLLQSTWPSLAFTTEINDLVDATDITFIIVPTPSDQNGAFSNANVLAVLTALARGLKKKDAFHVVNIVSTVMPCSCDNVFKPFLENSLGKTCGKDFGLVYNPEFIALGSVIKDFLNPDLVLIGASDPTSALSVRKIYETTCENQPHFAEMNLINAEITKLSLNCFVTMKISYVNELAAACEKVAGADVDVVTEALGNDSRIGSKVLKSGLGFGGPCFPRDTVAFDTFSRSVGTEALISNAVRQINSNVEGRLAEIIRSHVAPGQPVAVLGLSYKPDTHIIEKSPSINLIRRLLAEEYRISVHDPLANDEARLVFGDRIRYHQDAYEATKCAKAVILMTNWPQFQHLDWDRVLDGMDEEPLILDSWLLLKDRYLPKTRYYGLGLGEKRLNGVKNQA